jgi:hypothetical protein
MFERMTTRHGYSLRKLAQKLGKDKGYIENRLRLADAPPEVRDLVAVRRDTLSAAYELMKVADPRTRRRLATLVANGELSLVKLRQRIEGKPSRPGPEVEPPAEERSAAIAEAEPEAVAVPSEEVEAEDAASAEMVGLDLDEATEHLAQAVNELTAALLADPALGDASSVERQLYAKSLTLTKIKLENAIAVVRSVGGPRRPGGGFEPLG